LYLQDSGSCAAIGKTVNSAISYGQFDPTFSVEAGESEQLLSIYAGRGRHRMRWDAAYKVLILIFLVTLPLLNPWVRGDGVGYYAYIRAMLIEHDLNFEHDWLNANPSFRLSRVDADGRLTPENYTATHHINNHFSVGPAILWAPFLMVMHGAILGLNHWGWHFQADGFSRPYVITMAVATAIYGFAGLCFSFALARKYVEERWALIATIGVWFGSSFLVYMYLNPSWSHTHSAFAVGLFLWYWQRTMGHRSIIQWVALGAISGLMIDIYYPNALFLMLPGLEAFVHYAQSYRKGGRTFPSMIQMGCGHLSYLTVTGIVLLPTFVTRQIIYGNAFNLGYTESWYWTSPKLVQVLFSSNHGLFSWTPLLMPAVFGLALTWKQNRIVAISSVSVFLAFLYLIASYQNWDGISSFGNRFFVSLTPLFVLGLAMTLKFFSDLFVSQRRGLLTALLLVSLFLLWNIGLVLQWGMHLIPVRGPIVWRTVTYNQFVVVPPRIISTARSYLFRRTDLMQGIEKKDIEQLKQESPE
jgi:hypothetical protein